MSEIVTIGLDIAKSVFQVHGVDAAGQVVVTRQLKRGQMLKFFAALPPVLIGIEACGTAHHWGRQLQNLGHDGGQEGASHERCAADRQRRKTRTHLKGVCTMHHLRPADQQFSD